MKYISLLLCLFLLGLGNQTHAQDYHWGNQLSPTSSLTAVGNVDSFLAKYSPCLPILHVTESGSGLQDGSSWANSLPGTQLQAAINTAANCGGGQVWVAQGLYKPTSTTDRTASFSILSGVTVRGGYAADGSPGTRTAFPSSSTLSGVLSGTARSYHVVQFNEVSVGTTLDGFVITGGNADEASFPDNLGGGILSLAINAASSPMLSNVVITGNGASSGGGILASGEFHSLTATNALIQSNTAISTGGGIELNQGSSYLSSLSLIANTSEFGGGISMGNTHTMTMANALFQGNTVTFFGGGLYVFEGISNLNSVTFTANRAEKGGGIYIAESASSLTITNSLLQSNTATNVGGGLYAFRGGSSTLNSLSVIANSAILSGGGGIFVTDSHTLTAANTLFQSNSATNGGGLFLGAAQSLLVNSLWVGNAASNAGGGIGMDGTSVPSSLTLINATLYNNTAPLGTAIANLGSGQARLINTVGWGNGPVANTFNGTGIQASYSLFETGTTGFTDGGNNLIASPSPFVDAPNGNLRLNACALAIDTGDPASATGNSPYSVVSLPPTDLAGNARIFGGRVDMGAYEFSGGPCIACNAIIYVSESGSGVQNGSSWANSAPGTQLQLAINTAASCGGGQVWVARGVYKPTSTTARDVRFNLRNNVAVYGGFVGSETALNGRPALNPVTGQPSSSTLSGEIGDPASMTDNSQSIVYHPEALSLNSSAVLDGFVLTRGNGGPGGGMWNERGNSPTVRNCLFIENLGGGMYNLGSSPTLTDCSFQNNTTLNGGGGIYNENSSPSLTNCLFERNEAEHGGGVWNLDNSNTTLTNCIFRFNRVVSGSGGGLYNQDNSNATVTNCVFLSNTASNAGGGGMRNISSTVSMTNCIFQSNTAEFGGGIQHEGANLTVANSLFRANTASEGGGIYADDTPLRVISTSFERNASLQYGGAISGSGGTTLTNCSFQSNSANTGNNGGTDYGAVIQSVATFANCVEFGNQTGKAFTDPITATYSLFAPSSYTEVAISGSNNLTAVVSPFASTTSAELLPCSPAIDAGNPATTSATIGTTDLVENARFFAGGRIDMGAYEFQGVPGFTTTLIASNSLNCSMTSATLSASAGSGSLTYTFLSTSGLLPGSPSTNSTVTVNQGGSYSVLVTDANGCTASASTTVSSNTTTPTAGLVASGTITCAVPAATLTASGGSGLPGINYTFGGPGIVSVSGNVATVNVGGTYSVTVLNPANGCFATNTVSVSSDLGGAPPAPTLSASSSVVCAGSNVQVVATVGGSSPMQWYKDGQLVSSQTTATLTLSGVQAAQAGSYVLVISGACSVTSAPFSLTVNPLPTVTLIVPSGASVQGSVITLPAPLTGVNFQATGGVSYERVMVIDRVNGFEIRQVDSNPTGIFPVTRTGPFRLTVTDGNGCQRTVDGSIAVHP